jgi:N-dimethylarginine dimethylaminohydrolase
MINQHVLMSGMEYIDNAAAINPLYVPGKLHKRKAVRQHDNLVKTYRKAGVAVTYVLPPPGCQDGGYPANWAVCYNGKAIMARLPKARAQEIPYAKKVLESLGCLEVIDVPEDWRFSGQGDALRCGNLLFCNEGYRSDDRALNFVADQFGLERVQLQTIPLTKADGITPVINKSSRWPDSNFYDLDLAMNVIDDHTIVWCPGAFTETSRELMKTIPVEKIEVDYHEAITYFACNLVSTGESVIMSGGARKLKAELKRRGLKIFTPDISELTRTGGSARCMSLTIN